MLFSPLLLLLATAIPRLSQGYQYNPAVMEQHALGNSILDVVTHVLGTPSAPDNAKPTDEMVAEAGYPVETHIVATDDGYLLSVHRIPGGRLGGQVEGPRPTVFLQHGLLSSSADWVSFFSTFRPAVLSHNHVYEDAPNLAATNADCVNLTPPNLA